MKNKPNNLKYKKFIKYEGYKLFIGDIIGGELSHYIDEMDDVILDVQENWMDCYASRELLGKTLERFIKALKNTSEVVNEFCEPKFEKKKDLHEIIIEKLMYLHEDYENVVNRVDINDRRLNDDDLFYELYKAGEAGVQIIENILDTLYNIVPYTEKQRDLTFPDTQNIWQICNDNRGKIETKTLHTGFYDCANNRLLKKEVVMVKDIVDTKKDDGRSL